MDDYINGCYTKYGTRDLNIMEIKHKENIDNVFSYAIGYIPNDEDKISIDILENGKVICWEHNITTSVDIEEISDFSPFTQIVLNRLKEMRLI